jgi:hypothetical protein
MGGSSTTSRFFPALAAGGVSASAVAATAGVAMGARAGGAAAGPSTARGGSSSLTAVPGTWGTLRTPDPAAAAGSAGASILQPPPAAILSLEELCSASTGRAAGLLVPQTVSRGQLQAAHVLDQVRAACRQGALRRTQYCLCVTTVCPCASAAASGARAWVLHTHRLALHAQVDSKLVAVRCGPTLLAVDQHAADERVQLERLQQRLASQRQDAACAGATGAAGVAGEALLQRRVLAPAQAVSLSMQEVRALLLHQQQVRSWGWQVALQTRAGAGGGGVGAGDGSLLGASTPALLQQVPVLAGVQLGALDLQVGSGCEERRAACRALTLVRPTSGWCVRVCRHAAVPAPAGGVWRRCACQ